MRARARKLGLGTSLAVAASVALVATSAGPAPALTGPAGITRVSVSTAGVPADISTPTFSPPAVSTDGRFVAFDSFASNLAANAGEGGVFVRDTNAGTTTAASNRLDGTVDDAADAPAISADGRYVAFVSDATGLVAGGNSNFYQVYLRDRATGATTRVSTKPTGVQGSDDSGHPSLSADGRYVAFESDSPGLVAGDLNEWTDVFVRDRVTNTIKRVSVTSAGTEADLGGDTPSMSGDARFIAFTTYEQLSPADTNAFQDVYVRDQVLMTTTLVSASTGGVVANSTSSFPAISANGQYVAFQSLATDLDGTVDNNGTADVFVRSLATGTTQRVSRNASGGLAHGTAGVPSISGDGRYVAYDSDAVDAVTDDSNGATDAFVFDRSSSITSRISTDQLGQQLPQGGTMPVLTANGAYVAFATEGQITGLGPSVERQLYVRLTVPLNPASLPEASIGNASVAEGNTSTRQLRFTVSLSRPSSAATSLTYATLPGTATTDYTPKTGILTIPPGVTSGMVVVPVKGDTTAEANESFTVVLVSPQGATLRRVAGTGTITNDDPAAGALPRVSIGNASVVEGASGARTLRFAVTSSMSWPAARKVNYATVAGTAGAGDFGAKSGTVTVPANSSSAMVSISVTPDAAAEASETFKVKLSTPVGFSIQFGTGTGTIIDDD